MMVTPVPFVALAPGTVALCRSSRLLRPICPTRVPRVRAPYLVHLSRNPGSHVFDLERGAPRPGKTAPPWRAHITLVAGDVERVAPFRYPRRVSFPSDRLFGAPRKVAYSFGPRHWHGHAGTVYLAPPFLFGGQLGNHLVYRWRVGRIEYAVTLHAWAPLAQAIETLRALVESAPHPP
jgi:hypothetical protein